MNDQTKWLSARLWDIPCNFPPPMTLSARATARSYCKNVGHRSETDWPHIHVDMGLGLVGVTS